ncbi:MAG TPA: hypothetical protein VGY53_12990 [Isosphaeraceae bacterium]|nr:hypothetical protein [Isosphaeraceae bacterium]
MNKLRADKAPQDLHGPPAPGGDSGDDGAQAASGAQGGVGLPRSIKGIMAKISRGPAALTPLIGKELQANPPDWETIVPQSQKYHQLAKALETYEPPKGTKESWVALTADFTASSAELERAALAKDQKAASAAQGELANSCLPCHREHRAMRGGGMPPG